MVNYQSGKIYKLYSPSKNIVYIGSTTQSLSRRLSKHLCDYKAYNKDNSKKYLSSYLVLDCCDYKIELYEDYACNNKQQLEKKEGEYIKNNECVNKQIAGRTMKEYCLDNANKIKEQQKEWYIANVDKLKERTKQYRINNTEYYKEYYKQYNITNADKRKEYRITNADKTKEYNKQYRLKKKAEK